MARQDEGTPSTEVLGSSTPHTDNVTLKNRATQHTADSLPLFPSQGTRSVTETTTSLSMLDGPLTLPTQELLEVGDNSSQGDL